MKQSRRGILMCQPTQMEVFNILDSSFQEQYEVLINKRVADKKRDKNTEKITDNRSGKEDSDWIYSQKNNFTEQLLSQKSS